MTDTKDSEANVTSSVLTAKRSNPLWRKVLSPLLSWTLVLVVWQFLSTYVVKPFILPPPAIIANEMIEIVQSGELIRHFGASLSKLGQSFFPFFVLGALIGTAMAMNRWWEDFLRDAVSFAISLPGLVYILVLLLIFGSSGLAPIIAIVAAVTPYVALQFWEGVKGVPTDLLEMGNAFGMSRPTVLRHIVVPALSPYILTAVTHSFSLGWRLVVLTELFGGSKGIGFKMRAEFSLFSVRGTIAWALFFFIFALVLDLGILAPLSRYTLRWRAEEAT
jgi:NitT/TauT family transport system permease protein